MSGWRRMFGRILSPRSQLATVPSFSESAESPATADTVRKGHGVRWREIVYNIPLMIGLFIVIGLFLLVVFGPALAPQNPYVSGQRILPHLDRETGEFIRPPLEPSAEYLLGTNQWGADLLSLLMHGARNTLVAATFITMIRMILGLALGGLAGWNEDKLPDRVVTGIIAVLNALPILIISIILIYALDIRRGLPVFIVVLSLVGWTEIALYTRTEFLTLRKSEFVVSARSVGLNDIQVAVRHILPNVLPHLLVITFLEMGAVLMLLGELGFVGVYIGGGSVINIGDGFGPPKLVTLAEVPEWGAMIADGSRWLRSKPFIVMPPAFMFFIAVLGFNALGEGLRRLIEKYAVSTSFLLRKRMLVVIGIVTAATIFIMNNTGAAPWFASVARAFDTEHAYTEIETLAALDGRGNGQPGSYEAANYLAQQFEAFGLDPGWRSNQYIIERETRLVQATEQPRLALISGDGTTTEFEHQIDFGFVIDGHGGSGSAESQLTFIGFDPGVTSLTLGDFAGLDLRDRIVLLVEGNAPDAFATEALIRGARGILWVTGDGQNDVRSQIQLADEDATYLSEPTLPIQRIRPAVADALLEPTGLTITEIFGRNDHDQSGKGWFAHDLDSNVAMSVTLSEPQTVQIPTVLGLRPGSDFGVANEITVLFAPYDGLGVDPDGTVYPGANESASGVSMLLELARLWQEQELDTRRTTLFVAWGGSQLDDSGATQWLQDAFNFRHLRSAGTAGNVSPTAVLEFNGVGTGDGPLQIHPQSNQTLANHFLETGNEIDVDVVWNREAADFDQERLTRSIPWITFRWQTDAVPPDDDTVMQINRDRLGEFGRLLALAMTKVVRETEY